MAATALSASGLTWNNDTPAGAAANTPVRAFWGTSATNIYAALGSLTSAGKIYRWQGSSWTTVGGTTFDTIPVRSIFGFGSLELWAAGNVGDIRRSLDAGSSWALANTGTDPNERLIALWGASNTDIWAGGFNSTNNASVLRRYNGSSWSLVSTAFGTNKVNSIWGTAANSVFVTGDGGRAARWNGSSLDSMNTGTTEQLIAVWGLSANEVYAVGSNAKIIKWDGSSWSNFSNSGIVSTLVLNGITGTSSNDLYVCTGDGANNLYHWNGTVWSQETTAGNSLNAIWSSPDGTRFVAGGAASRLYGATAAAAPSPEVSVAENGNAVTDEGSFSFGSTSEGVAVSKTFTVSNNGTGSLTLSGLTVPSGFSIAQNFASTSIAAGGSTTFQITMTAAAAGNPSGTLLFTTNDADEGTYNFTISGTVNVAAPVQVSGRCITGVANLLQDTNINGKVAYVGSANAFGGTVADIYWSNDDSCWYLAFGGQPYFYNTTNSALPPSTTVSTWPPTAGNTDCVSGPALVINGSGTSTAAPGIAISSLARTSGSPSKDSMVNWTLTFASAVTGLTSGNFTLVGAAAAGSSVGSPSTTNSGLTWNIPVTTGGTDGELTLNLANATGLSSAISNSLPYAGQSYTIDKTAPTVQSVTRFTPVGQATSLTTVVFRVTYSEPVTLNVPETARFAVVPVNGSTIAGAVAGVTGSGNYRDVTVNITSGTGEFRLRVLD